MSGTFSKLPFASHNVSSVHNHLFLINDDIEIGVWPYIERRCDKEDWNIKNNRLEAVLISTTEYERLKHYEEIVEALENNELLRIVEQRSITPLSEYVSSEDMAKKFNIDLNSL